jgi:predicted ArsR family transcriptional regulator
MAEIAEALGLERKQVEQTIWTLLRAGAIACVSEVHSVRRAGRNEKVYQRSEKMGRATDAEKIRGAVFRFSDRYEFTTTDVARDLRIRPATVRLVLEALEKSGAVARVIDSRRPRGGRPAPRWTSNADNVDVQRHLAELEQMSDAELTES